MQSHPIHPSIRFPPRPPSRYLQPAGFHPHTRPHMRCRHRRPRPTPDQRRSPASSAAAPISSATGAGPRVTAARPADMPAPTSSLPVAAGVARRAWYRRVPAPASTPARPLWLKPGPTRRPLPRHLCFPPSVMRRRCRWIQLLPIPHAFRTCP